MMLSHIHKHIYTGTNEIRHAGAYRYINTQNKHTIDISGSAYGPGHKDTLAHITHAHKHRRTPSQREAHILVNSHQEVIQETKKADLGLISGSVN